MNSLYIKLLIIGLALLAIVLALHLNFGPFVSDLYLETQRGGAAIPADPTCPKGQYSKKTGGVCSGSASDSYDYSKDTPETARGANGELHNVGSYDAKPSRRDDVDYTTTDVLKKPASITYPDWVIDPRTNRDLDEDASSRGYEDIDSKPSRSIIGINSGGSRRMNDMDTVSMDRDLDSTERAYKKGRPSINELIDTRGSRHSEMPVFKSRDGHQFNDEEDYMDNRLSHSREIRTRQFDLPSKSSYSAGAARGYDPTSTNTSCNNADEDDAACCEGFSPLI